MNMISINRSSPLPLYQQLKDRIRDDIECGLYKQNERIPTEKELEVIYNVSRTTVRMALEELVLEGLLYRRQGVGTFVAEPKLEYALGKLTSFTEDFKRKGQFPTSKLISLTLQEPSLRIAKQFSTPSNSSTPSQIYEIVRLRLADSKPVGIHIAYITQSSRFNIDDLRLEMEKEDSSLYHFFESRGISIYEGTETIEATVANDYEACLLEVPPKSPLLLVTRTTFDGFKTPVEFVKIIYRADRYRYTIHLSASN